MCLIILGIHFMYMIFISYLYINDKEGLFPNIYLMESKESKETNNRKDINGNKLQDSLSFNAKTKADITIIIEKYIKKEKENYNLNNYDILILEEDLQNRYKENNSNNFSFPEIKNVLDCIADILTYFKETEYLNDNKMSWQIEQTLNGIKNASQETICTDINIKSSPPHGTISIIQDVKDQEYINVKKVNNIYSHDKKYGEYNIYETPYHGNIYPYAYCIRVMAQSLNMIDLIILDIGDKKDNNIWHKDIANNYFQARYHYYLDYLLDNAPNVFILPILQNISATSLIRNRCSRIQPCGIIFDAQFVDEDIQTPCNWLWHDINHARRIYQNNVWYSKQKNITIDALYEIMREEVKTIIPLKNWLQDNDNKYDDIYKVLLFENDIEYENIIKMLLFEIVHEDALPFVKECIINDILFKSGNSYPYERTYDNDEEDKKYNRINLRFYEQGASTLRTYYNKLRHTFFEKDYANDKIIKKEMRYIKPIIYASYLLLNKLEPSKYNKNNMENILHDLKILIKDTRFQEHNATKLMGVYTDIDDAA